MVADGQRRRRHVRLAVAEGSYAFLVAAAFTAGWALVARDPWDWDRFWLWFPLMLMIAAMSHGARAVADRLPPAPPPGARQKSLDDDQTAQAMRTGILPPGADQDIWRARIQREGREARMVGTFGAILCVVTATLTAAVAHVRNDNDPLLWAMVLLALLPLAPLFSLVVRLRRRRERLLTQL